jgi:hypothetical protein
MQVMRFFETIDITHCCNENAAEWGKWLDHSYRIKRKPTIVPIELKGKSWIVSKAG